MKAFKFVAINAIAFFTSTAQAQSISGESKLLSQCEFSYFYAGQLMQLRNNEGAAKALVRRSAMMTTANFMLNEENGVIASWKIRDFTLLREPLKRDFDGGTRDSIAFTADCDRNATPIAIRIRNSGKMLWGKSFDDLQLELFNKSRATLGL